LNTTTTLPGLSTELQKAAQSTALLSFCIV
jgi:hypothetical protein